MKTLILSVAILAVVYSAAAPVCGTDKPGVTTLGVCQYCHPQCKTCLTPAADKCTACHDATFTAPASTGAACVCSNNAHKITTTAAATHLTCAALGTAPVEAKIPFNYGILSTDGTNGADKQYVGECAHNTAATKFCKLCTDLGATATPKATCTACTTGAADPCNPATGKFFLTHIGEVDECPSGYVADGQLCKACGAGCASCTTAALNECLSCAPGHIINGSKACVAATATGDTACDATCESLKCQNTAKNCTACKDATYEFTAAGTCTLKPTVQLCKTVDTADATKCKADGCMDNSTLAADAKSCVCKSTHWFKKVTFDGTKTPVVAHAYECAACAKTCTTGQKCKADGTDCETDPNATPAATCTDATALKGGCSKCDKVTKDSKDTYPCTACNATLKFDSATASCACEKTSDEAVWDAVNMNCAVCTPKCTDTTKKFCSIKTAAASKGVAPVTECSITEPAKPPTTTGTPANNNAGTTASNGILISALSLLSLVFLA